MMKEASWWSRTAGLLVLQKGEFLGDPDLRHVLYLIRHLGDEGLLEANNS